jgi:preprotein translocase subunit SecE
VQEPEVRATANFEDWVMATTTTETSESGVLDILKPLIAAGVLVGGLFAYYYYVAWSLPIRVLLVLGGLAAGIAIAMTSTQGQRLWAFIQGSRIEIRKVIWPTKQETMQTAMAVFVFTLVMALFFWGLDSFLLWLTRTMVGSTG